MTKEYIEREALIKKIFPIGLIDDGRYAIPAKAVKTAIDNAPIANVVEVNGDINILKEKKPTAIWVGTDKQPIEYVPVAHGEWKDNHCTACGMMPMGEEIWDSCEFAPPKFEYYMDYCPNCGAKMDGGKHGN